MNSILEKKKKAENELEAMVKDLKEKLDKYDQDKKSVLKGEKNKREAVSAKLESEKKDLEEKLEKMKIQFEKAAVESRKTMSRVEEENVNAKNIVAEAQVNSHKNDLKTTEFIAKLLQISREIIFCSPSYKRKRMNLGQPTKKSKVLKKICKKVKAKSRPLMKGTKKIWRSTKPD